MTIQHTPGDSGVERPATDVASKSSESLRDAIGKIKREEIVFVLPGASNNQGSYLIYSLSEESASNGEKPFVLNVVPCQEQELPDDLSGFVLSRDSLPPAHLSGSRELHVVVSTGSGLQRAEKFYEEVLHPLLSAAELQPRELRSERGYRVTLTRNSNTIREFAQELGADSGAEEKTIVLLSGDGGVVDLLNGLDHASAPPSIPTIALLPLGTGNALFHSLHKPHYSTEAENPGPSPLVLGLRTLFWPTTAAAPLPTFRASFSPGAKLISDPNFEKEEKSNTTGKDEEQAENGEEQHHRPVTHLVGAIVASYGFHASLVWESDTPAYRVHGDKRFGMAAGELLRVGHAYNARVEVRRRRGDEAAAAPHHDDEDDDSFAALLAPSTGGVGGSSDRFDYVLATLVSNLEKTFTISPAGRPLDGRLRLVYFGDVGGSKTMEIMMAAYREGSHVGMAEVGYEEVEEVRVTVAEEDARWRKVCIDGSIVELETGGWMRVKREEGERLRVLVNADY
ncbi:ATP-NAD kinase-like domain-containing protein [Corynascus novoguineensis]|uniref:ATP-NAD kinase-like domain-containing protein n=1 Tax=Corynascus novoguineensis TaxID=1126955 RepID=A0AAN7HML0_9PEZI|nr:ATP-NAD kinase-like domain-containing protein [Corynascus novoguineensis]